jgi:von Willebrand factor A domain-containing protein 8
VLVDQAVVRAALEGRVLLLEGIERVERNILPLLNNLLENRELTLDDGRILLSSDRYEKLIQNSSRKLERVHPNFRIIGLMRIGDSNKPNSTVTAKLDPPLRSRFQARYIPKLSSGSLLELFHSLSPTLSQANPSILSDFARINQSLSSFTKGKFHDSGRIPMSQFILIHFVIEAAQSDLVSQPPTIPQSKAFQFVESLESLSPLFKDPKEESNRSTQVKETLHRLLRRIHPYTLFPTDQQTITKKLLEKFQFANVTAMKNPVPIRIESINTCDIPWNGTIHLAQGSNRIELQMPVGVESAEVLSAENCSTDQSETLPYIPLESSEAMLAEIIEDHSLGRDICLVGEKGCGKTILNHEFARRLGYSVESLLLFKDMSSRDLLIKRNTVTRTDGPQTFSDTVWEYSPLVRAAVLGRIAVLDNIDRLHPTTLATLSVLVQDREVSFSAFYFNLNI